MISIIIPTLNEEKAIADTLNSLKKSLNGMLCQIIVSDGRSTDKTAEIARQCVELVVVHNEDRRQTIAEGRNKGAAAASGDLLVFLDADCKIPHADEFFKKVVSYFEEDKNLVALAPSVKVLPEVATIPDKIIFWIRNWTFDLGNNFFHIPGVAGECMIVKKEAFQKIGGLREDLVVAEDLDFFRRLAKVGNVMFARPLVVLHTNRRGHKIGWPKLLWQWFTNTLSLTVSKKVGPKEWKVIR